MQFRAMHLAAILLTHWLLKAGAADPSHLVRLQVGAQSYELEPRTLALVVAASSGTTFPVSALLTPGLPVSDLETSRTGVSWRFPTRGLRGQASVLGDGSLDVALQCETPETSFTWPVQPLARAGASALIWPRREGHFIPLGDHAWISFLMQETHDTLEGLSMPFWGVVTPAGVLSCVCSTQYHNEIALEEEEPDRITLRFSHTFREGEPTTVRLRFRLGDVSDSPLKPAFEYRRWLQEEGRFVTLVEKIRRTPAAERLLGAPHVYLWGGGVLTRSDLERGDVKRLAKLLLDGAGAPGPTPARRIQRALSPETWKGVVELARSRYRLPYVQSALADELNRLLAQPDFYDAPSWKDTPLSTETQTLSARLPGGLAPEELIRLNRRLLFEAFPDALPPPETWGGSLSPAMLEALTRAGLDRLRISLADWESMTGNRSFAEEADRLGYLIGPYDSYHSIHDPDWRGTDATWPTAQFDRELYETVAIVNRDGTKRKGFKQKGYLLSPAAAHPWVERRVAVNAARAPFNYYFFDCDGYGQVYDDYSLLHPATQMFDAAARCDRMRWTSEKFGAVIGTEGGSAYAASTVHLFEGAFQDGFGWGDPDMSDRNSPYFLGAYHPPDAPAVFFKPVPVKNSFIHLHFDPRFRLPLFEAVFHDSVVSGHHWSVPSLKFTSVQTTVALTELLYQVPPMYHLNPEELERRQEVIGRHYAVFSPLHRMTGLLPLADFQWLTPDRLVQRTLFGERVELIANFSGRPFDYHGNEIPAGACGWRISEGELMVYKP